MWKKVESSSSEALKNRSNWSGKEENFFKPTGKADKWTIVLCVGGENRAADPNHVSLETRI